MISLSEEVYLFIYLFICFSYVDVHVVPLDMKGYICHFRKWQIHPFISKGTMYV